MYSSLNKEESNPQEQNNEQTVPPNTENLLWNKTMVCSMSVLWLLNSGLNNDLWGPDTRSVAEIFNK